jgi:hypothetical protein
VLKSQKPVSRLPALSIITLVLAAQHNYPRHKKQGCKHNH